MLEKTFESPLDCKEIQPVHPQGYQSWVFIGRTDSEAETPVLWLPHMKSWLIGKDHDAGRGWGAGVEGDDRGWGGWVASPTRWAWVWVNSRSWWWTEGSGVLWFMGSQRVGHDWVTELNWLFRLYSVFLAVDFYPCIFVFSKDAWYDFNLLQIYWNLFYVPPCDMSWKIFYVHLKSRCILLLLEWKGVCIYLFHLV